MTPAARIERDGSAVAPTATEGTPSAEAHQRLRGLEGRARRSRPSPGCGLAPRGSCEPAAGRGRPHGAAVYRDRACPARNCLGRLLDRRGRDRLRDRTCVVVDVGALGRCPGPAARWHCGHRRAAANILSATEAARLVDVAEGLFAVFGLPGAEIRVLDDPAANAISVGRSPDRGSCSSPVGSSCSWTGSSSRRAAHELAHIKRGDTVSGAIAVLASTRSDAMSRPLPELPTRLRQRP